MTARNKGFAGLAATMLLATAVVGPSSFANPEPATNGGNGGGKSGSAPARPATAPPPASRPAASRRGSPDGGHGGIGSRRSRRGWPSTDPLASMRRGRRVPNRSRRRQRLGATTVQQRRRRL
jgi:hypothetical protein